MWIDLLRLREAGCGLLSGELGLGPLVVEDGMVPLRMPKMDTFDGGVFVAAFAVRLDREEKASAHLRAVEAELVWCAKVTW